MRFAPLAFLVVAVVIVAATSAQQVTSSTTTTTTDTGAPVSSSISSLTVSTTTNSLPSSTAPVHSAQPAPHYTIPSSQSSNAPVASVSPTTDDVLPEFNIPNELLTRDSHVPAAPIYKPVENSSSSVHVAIENTQYSKAYIVPHSGAVSSSVIDALERQASIFIPGIAKSKFSDLPAENLDDDQDSSLVIGGQFAFQNVQCMRSNGTTYAIPDVPCQRVKGHPNLCYPLCAERWQPYCTPQCTCRDNFDSTTYTSAAIMNCTKGFFPQPTRLRESSWYIWLLAFVSFPSALLFGWMARLLHVQLVQFGGMSRAWRELRNMVETVV